jgi:hypothetical protein
LPTFLLFTLPKVQLKICRRCKIVITIQRATQTITPLPCINNKAITNKDIQLKNALILTDKELFREDAQLKATLKRPKIRKIKLS